MTAVLLYTFVLSIKSYLYAGYGGGSPRNVSRCAVTILETARVGIYCLF